MQILEVRDLDPQNSLWLHPIHLSVKQVPTLDASRQLDHRRSPTLDIQIACYIVRISVPNTKTSSLQGIRLFGLEDARQKCK